MNSRVPLKLKLKTKYQITLVYLNKNVKIKIIIKLNKHFYTHGLEEKIIKQSSQKYIITGIITVNWSSSTVWYVVKSRRYCSE